MKHKALFSLNDTSRAVEFAKVLVGAGWEVIASKETVDVLKTEKTCKQITTNRNFSLRKDFIFELLKQISSNTKIISTTGYTSRELAQIRKENK